MSTNIGVHASHCCVLHGCKYRDDDCPVESGQVEQKYLCEICAEYDIESLELLKRIVEEERKNDKPRCPHCHTVLFPDDQVALQHAFDRYKYWVEYTKQFGTCHAGMDGECTWEHCPQERDGEPAKSGRSCPLIHYTDDPEW